MTLQAMCKQYSEDVCRLDIRRKFLKSELTKIEDLKKCKELETRIGLLSEEIYETNEIIKFLKTRYGGDSLNG